MRDNLSPMNANVHVQKEKQSITERAQHDVSIETCLLLPSVLNSSDPQVRSLDRNNFTVHMQRRKVSAARPGKDNFGGYKANKAYALDKKR